jgi:hypothetical protein
MSNESRLLVKAGAIAALAFAPSLGDAQPSELLKLPQQFHVRSELEFVEYALPELSRSQQKFTAEANSWYLKDRVVVALDYGGHLEVVSWESVVGDYSRFESSTRYFLDPNSNLFLNRGGNNNYGPSEIFLDAAPLNFLHNARVSTNTADLWKRSPDGLWNLTFPYAPTVSRGFRSEAGGVTEMKMTRKSNGATLLVRSEKYGGQKLQELEIGDTVTAENWASIRPGAVVQSSRSTSKIVSVEVLQEDTTEEEVLASLTNGLLEVRHEEYFDADTKKVTSMRRGVTAPNRSPVGDSSGKAVYSSTAPPKIRSRFGSGGIVIAALAMVALVAGFLTRRSRPKQSGKR